MVPPDEVVAVTVAGPPPGVPPEQPDPTGMDRLMQHLVPLATRFGLPREDLDAMVEPWRWRAAWGATLAAMAASAGLRPWVYSRGEVIDTVPYQLKWVLLIVFMVLGGMAGDLYGRRRLLIVSLAGLTVSSFLTALSSSSPALYSALSLITALCGAVALPLTLAVLRVTLQQQMLGIGVMFYMCGYGIGIALPYLGAALGAWLGPAYASVPIVLAGAVGLDGVSAYTPLDGPVNARGSDLVAAALFVLSIGCFSLGVQHAGAADTRAVVAAAWVIAGFVGLGAFAWWQSRLPHPALDLASFRQRWFLAALLAGAVVSFALQVAWRAGLILLVALIGQITPDEVRRIVVIGIVGAGVGMGVSAMLSSRVNGGHLMAAGIGAMAAGMFGVSLLVWRSVHLTWLSLPVALITGGLVLGTMLRTLVILAGVPKESVGSASGLLNGVGFLGGLFAPLVVRPVMGTVTVNQFTAALAAMGLAPDQVASPDASFTADLGQIISLLGQAPQAIARELVIAFQAATRDGLVVLALIVGVALAVSAVTIWVAWRGHDTPLWPPPKTTMPGSAAAPAEA